MSKPWVNALLCEYLGCAECAELNLVPALNLPYNERRQLSAVMSSNSPLFLMRCRLWLGLAVAVGTLAMQASSNPDDRWFGRFLAELPARPTSLAIDGNHLYVGLQDALARWDERGWSFVPGTTDGLILGVARAPDGIYVAGQFTRIGNVAARNIARWTGTEWQALGQGLDAGVDSLMAAGDAVYASGNFRQAGDVQARYIAKWQYGRWHALAGAQGDGLSSPAWDMLCDETGRLYVTGGFTEAGGVEADGIAMWDGEIWAPLGTGLRRETLYSNGVGIGSALAIWNGDLYVGGHFTHAGGQEVKKIAKWTGEAWSDLAGGVGLSADNSEVSDLTAGPDGLYVSGTFVIAGGKDAASFAKWDGTGWSALLPETNTRTVGRFVLHPSGELWALGNFDGSMGVAEYREGQFHSLAKGVVWDLYAMAAGENGIYGGGRFTKAGGAVLNHIGLWNERHWEPLGAGAGGNVHAMAVHPNGDVFIGGEFTSVAGQPIAGLARWNGTTWSALGGGISGWQTRVFALHIEGNDLYVGGTFSHAGGQPANNVARWDGQNWHALGQDGQNGVSSRVLALSSLGGNLYVGGAFNLAGGQPADGLALWKPETQAWTGITGFQKVVSTLPVSVHVLQRQGTNLIIGGYFTVGAAGSTNLAQWNGSALQSLAGARANSVFGSVFALDVQGEDLYVGGQFETVGGIEARSIARFDGQNWFALGSGINGKVNALAVKGDSLYAGGAFNRAGGKLSSGIAQWAIHEKPSQVVFSSPSDNSSFIAGQVIQLHVTLADTLSDVLEVEFYSGLKWIGRAAAPPYELLWGVAPPGEHVLTARAVISSGQIVHSSPVKVIITPPPGNLKPVIEVFTPPPGFTVTEGTPVKFHINAEDIDGEIAQVAFFVDGVLMASVVEQPYVLLLTHLARGVRTLVARAYDDAGAWTDSEPVSVTVERANLPPILNFVEPRPGTYELPAPIRFLAGAEDYDGELVSVEFFANDVRLSILAAKSVGSYEFFWTNAIPGQYSVTAVATDNQGATTSWTFQGIVVVSQNVRPMVKILSPAPGAHYTEPVQLTVQVDATDPDGTIQEVRLFAGEIEVGSVTAAPFEFQMPFWTDGTYRLKAEAEDDRGGVSVSSEVEVTVVTSAIRFQIIPLGAQLGAELRYSLGLSESFGDAINSAGIVAGRARRYGVLDKAFRMEVHPIFRRPSLLVPFPEEVSFGSAGAHGINDAGQIVGFAKMNSGANHAFLFEGDRAISLGTLAGTGESYAYGINNHGQIVGISRAPAGVDRAFLFENGQMRDLGSFGDGFSHAEAINDLGQIVGFAYVNPQIYQAFVYNSSEPSPTMMALGALPPDFPLSRALALNARGQIVGRVERMGGLSRAFIHENGELRDLGTLGGTSGSANGVNDQGVVVGHSTNYERDPRACIWLDGIVYDLNQLIPADSGWKLKEARAINDCGQIVGIASRSGTDNRQAFLLNPVPVLDPAPGLILNEQTGMYEHKVRLANPSPLQICEARLLIQGLPDAIQVKNGIRHNGTVYFEHGFPLPPHSDLEVTVEFIVPAQHAAPSPVYRAETGAPPIRLEQLSSEVVIRRNAVLADGSLLLEFDSLPDRSYEVQYSPDMGGWIPASQMPILGKGSRILYQHAAPPATGESPSENLQFYRLLLHPEE
jgi:trimeric autotransporter adhesin